MGNCFEQRHIAYPEKQCLYRSEGRIHQPEALCCFPEAWGQSVRCRAGGFSSRQFDAANAEKGENRNRQHDDSHTADPLCEGAP